MKTSTFLYLILALSAVVCISCAKEETVSAAPSAASSPAPAETATAPAAAAPATTAAAQPVSTPPAAGVIATADGEQSGVRAEITELRRSSGGTLNLKVTLVNDSSESLTFGYAFVDSGGGYGDVGGIHLIDPVGKKKYFVARDSEGKCVSSRDQKDLPAGQKRNIWAKFPAPPAEVKKISVVIPKFMPLDDVPIAE